MKGKIFVTGGAGFIGSRVVRALLAHGYEVRCLLRSTTQTRRIEGLTYERFEGDITNLQSLEEGMKGCDGVFHLASLSNWKDIKSSKMPQVVIEGSKNMIEAAKKNGNLKMVYVSSSTAIDGTDELIVLNEDSPLTLPCNQHYVYAHAKKKVEEYCKQEAQQGYPVVIVNPTEVYGPYDYDKITSGNLIDFATTKTVQLARGGTSIVYVDDVAEGIVAAFEKGRSGERYILGGDNVEFKDLAQMTLDILGIQKPVKSIGRGMLLMLAWISKTFGINMGFEPAVIPYAVKYWFVDNSKARNELGISFRSAKETLEPTLKWIREEGLLP
ncbi:MAG: NAD-dependent epimerase/dehydratase family protein [Candidatus Competibacteraceae bacterium]|nr:NAD-dependent epimerase/dehydratase family protein [Candidatus Competibacteraceae bacterium]